MASGDHSSSRCAGLSLSRPLLFRSTGSRRAGSVIVAHGPSCSAACGIFSDQGSNPCPLHWQADSQPLRHQGSPIFYFLGQCFPAVVMSWLTQKTIFVLKCGREGLAPGAPATPGPSVHCEHCLSEPVTRSRQFTHWEGLLPGGEVFSWSQVCAAEGEMEIKLWEVQ